MRNEKIKPKCKVWWKSGHLLWSDFKAKATSFKLFTCTLRFVYLKCTFLL